MSLFFAGFREKLSSKFGGDIRLIIIVMGALVIAYSLMDRQEELVKTLKQIWSKYLPTESNTFIDELSVEQLDELVDLLLTGDVEEQAKKIASIETKIHQSHQTLQQILQRLQKAKNRFLEEKDTAGDEADLERLEQML